MSAVDDTLDDSRVVPQVYEGKVLAVLAAPRDPPADRDGAAGVGRPQLAAVVRPEPAGAPGRRLRAMHDRMGTFADRPAHRDAGAAAGLPLPGNSR